MPYRKINASSDAEIFDFSEDSEIEGELVGVKQNVGANKSMMYYIQDKNGVVWAIWGAAALDGQMMNIKIGDRIQIKYLGMATSEKTKRQYKNFEVSVWED